MNWSSKDSDDEHDTLNWNSTEYISNDTTTSLSLSRSPTLNEQTNITK